MEINNYLDIVSKPTHEAGGGSVAALNGALAISLILKAYNMIKKNLDKDLDQKIEFEFYKELIDFKDYYLNMVKKDGETFGEVLQAYKLSKNSESETHFRDIKIQDGYKKALESQFRLINKSIKLYEYLYILKKYSNKMYGTELEVAANQIMAAVRSAKVNVLINIEYIKDIAYTKNIMKKLEEMEVNYNFHYMKITEIN